MVVGCVEVCPKYDPVEFWGRLSQLCGEEWMTQVDWLLVGVDGEFVEWRREVELQVEMALVD